MSKWCDTCYRNKFTDEWKPCDSNCPVFGKNFEELARIVIEIKFRDKRECANCGRFNKETRGCGRYVDDCMIDGDAYSNWIPKGDV